MHTATKEMTNNDFPVVRRGTKEGFRDLKEELDVLLEVENEYRNAVDLRIAASIKEDSTKERYRAMRDLVQDKLFKMDIIITKDKSL